MKQMEGFKAYYLVIGADQTVMAVFRRRHCEYRANGVSFFGGHLSVSPRSTAKHVLYYASSLMTTSPCSVIKTQRGSEWWQSSKNAGFYPGFVADVDALLAQI